MKSTCLVLTFSVVAVTPVTEGGRTHHREEPEAAVGQLPSHFPVEMSGGRQSACTDSGKESKVYRGKPRNASPDGGSIAHVVFVGACPLGRSIFSQIVDVLVGLCAFKVSRKCVACHFL